MEPYSHSFDKYEGWVDNKQYLEISEKRLQITVNEQPLLSTDLLEYII